MICCLEIWKSVGIHQGSGPFGSGPTSPGSLNQLFSFCIGSLILEPSIDFLKSSRSPHQLFCVSDEGCWSFANSSFSNFLSSFKETSENLWYLL